MSFWENQYDCKIIQEEFRENGYFISLRDAYELWKKVSDDACASWLMVESYQGEIFHYATIGIDLSVFQRID